MGILNRIRRRASVRRAAPGAEPERFALSAELPLGGVSTPLWRVDLQMVSEPHADGEKLRLRAHFQTNFASALRSALEAPAQAALPHQRTLAQRAGALAQRTVERALAVPGLRAAMQPLLRHDFNTWVELHATTASLDGGARELLPQGERLKALGIQPRRSDDAPVAESWAGESPNGFAQVSMLQIDKKHLPPRLSELFGERPFHLAAAIVNTVEQK